MNPCTKFETALNECKQFKDSLVYLFLDHKYCSIFGIVLLLAIVNIVVD